MHLARYLLISCLLPLMGCSDHNERQFDAAKWQSADVNSRTRGQMLNDLITRHRFIGKTEAEVTALLGPPLQQRDKFREWNLVYVTGPLGMDYEWLVLRTDRHHRIVKYRVISD